VLQFLVTAVQVDLVGVGLEPKVLTEPIVSSVLEELAYSTISLAHRLIMQEEEVVQVIILQEPRED
jgi:hypothetical protein